MKHVHRLVLATLAGTAVLSACTVHHSLTEFDALARTGPARTIVLEESFSLYSPYDVHTTREYVPLITEQQAEVFALFGVASPPPIVVHLREDEGIGADVTVVGDQLRFDGISMDPEDGFLGWAGEELVVRVAPVRPLRLGDGREIKGVLGASMYTSTVRLGVNNHEAPRVPGDLPDSDCVHLGLVPPSRGSANPRSLGPPLSHPLPGVDRDGTRAGIVGFLHPKPGHRALFDRREGGQLP